MAFLEHTDGSGIVEGGSGGWTCTVAGCGCDLGFCEVVVSHTIIVGVGFEAADDVQRAHFVTDGAVVACCVAHVVCCRCKVSLEIDAIAMAV